MYRGLPSRLEKEVRALYLQKVLKGDSSRLAKFKLRVEDPPRRKHLVWLGGAVLGSIMADRKVRSRRCPVLRTALLLTPVVLLSVCVGVLDVQGGVQRDWCGHPVQDDVTPFSKVNVLISFRVWNLVDDDAVGAAAFAA